MSENGHANGLAKGGEGGAIAQGSQAQPRKALMLLTRAVQTGQEVTERETAANIRFAVSVRDDPASNTRDKLRATEFLEALAARGIDVALYLDKCDRLDGGHVTERVGFMKYVGGVSEDDL